MLVQHRAAAITCIAFFGAFFLSARSEAADATIAAGDNYRLDLTIMGQTMGEDSVVEYQDKTIIIRKPMQPAKYAFQGKIEGDRLTAESNGTGPTLKLEGKVTAPNVAEGTVKIIVQSGMEITGTFKLFKK